jgi:hypothetical protein
MKNDYISLKEASHYCSYSQDYLKLRARQGKLKAIKMGRNWFTTREWLEEYIKKFSKRGKKFPVSGMKLVNFFLFILNLIMVFIILSTIINFKIVELGLEKIIPAKTIEIKR